MLRADDIKKLIDTKKNALTFYENQLRILNLKVEATKELCSSVVIEIEALEKLMEEKKNE